MRDRFTGIFQAVRPKEQPEQVYALLTYAPPEVSHALDDIRRRYDPAYKDGIKPHITVKRPAPLRDPKYLGAMVKELGVMAARLKPFPVDLNGYNTFRKHEANVAFLKIQDEASFCNLHSKVMEVLNKVFGEDVADQFEGPVYHPHLTIGNNLSDLELAVMEHELAQGDYHLHFNFWITGVTLMTQASGQIWQTINTFEFPT